MTKEEIFKARPQNDIKEECEDLWVRVKFNVACDSSPYIQHERSIAARVARYVNRCFEAMDESMRHWGDHTHIIEPTSIKLYNSRESGKDNEGIELIDDLDPYWNNIQEKYDISKLETL